MFTLNETKVMQALTDVYVGMVAVVGANNDKMISGQSYIPDIAEQDFREAVAHIHALQNMILANVAARSIPKEVRQMGRRIDKT